MWRVTNKVIIVSLTSMPKIKEEKATPNNAGFHQF